MTPPRPWRAAQRATDPADPLADGDVWLTNAQAARLLGGVSPKTVARWAAAGKLPHTKTLGGHRRYEEVEVLKLAEQLRNNGADQVK